MPMKQKIFIALCERTFKIVVQVLYNFVLHCFVDEIFQFECFLLPANYITLCIMSFC